MRPSRSGLWGWTYSCLAGFEIESDLLGTCYNRVTRCRQFSAAMRLLLSSASLELQLLLSSPVRLFLEPDAAQTGLSCTHSILMSVVIMRNALRVGPSLNFFPCVQQQCNSEHLLVSSAFPLASCLWYLSLWMVTVWILSNKYVYAPWDHHFPRSEPVYCHAWSHSTVACKMARDVL